MAPRTSAKNTAANTTSPARTRARALRRPHRYRVVAMEMPIVFTIDGDHDPSGLMFTLKAYQPLLEWVRDRWNDDDGYLPALHMRRQRIQLIVDALPRLEQQLAKLAAGTDDDLALLQELYGAELGGFDADGESGDDDRKQSHHIVAARAHVTATLTELRTALDELGALELGELPLVSANAATRASWLAHWKTQLAQADQGIAAWFTRLEADPTRALTDDRMLRWQQRTKIPVARIKRLLYNDHTTDVSGLGTATPHYDRCNPMRPITLVRPLVLRARRGEPFEVEVENQIRRRRLGFHVQGDGLGGDGAEGVRFGDGAHVGANPDTTIAFGDTRVFHYRADHEGVWAINDTADVRGTERGTNSHGLFGAIVVEPPGARWRDPETGDDLTFQPYGDGANLDVIMAGEDVTHPDHANFVDFHLDDVPRSFREFTVFIHDEPSIHSGMHAGAEHTVMPLSYRAEPMPNRLPHRMRRYVEATPPNPDPSQVGVDRRAFTSEIGPDLEEVFWTARTPDGEFLERVAGEEQHHSSWLFGEPVTPVLRAYRGDPARIRLVHAGVKETHVFHLHVHQWRAVPQDTAPPSVWRAGEHRGSQLLDSITIGPQTSVTIDPLYGSGSRQRAVGDIIWHCHLYPHFHHGMWGLWRSFDRLVDGSRAYPDGTPCQPLLPLDGRVPPAPTATALGFPWFIDGEFPQKSPPPPALRDEDLVGRRQLLQMPKHSVAEHAAFDPGCAADPHPGALFVDLDGLARAWNADAGLPPPRIISYDVRVSADPVTYNSHGWHDPIGHHYTLLSATERQLDADGNVVSTATHVLPAPAAPEVFFPRANHGDIVELTFHNDLTSFPADHYDVAQLPVECGLHVHLVKFDPLTADGSSTGWNYISGASCREAVGPDTPGDPPRNFVRHRWVVDEEFGPCFFHDHLLANFRQKHGLFAALIAEPHGSQWHTLDQAATAWSGTDAVVVPPLDSGLPPYREACLGVGDFIPMLDEDGQPLNPPGELSGDDDPGSMGVNYRSAPLTHRGDDPSEWFASSGDSGDPDTPVIRAYPGERLRLRLIQGSHEEQHSFVAHGLRWPKEWHNDRSVLVNQQTIGISEAFTLDIDPDGRSPYGIGDHLWQFSAMDDLWVGCWGLLRVLPPVERSFDELPPLPSLTLTPDEALEKMQASRACPPRPHLTDMADPTSWSAPVREFVVTARRIEHRLDGEHLTDPWGLIYEVADGWRPDDAQRPNGNRRATGVHRTSEPLVLRARRGEWVRVTLINEVLREQYEDDPRHLPFGVEPSPPRLPLERLDEFGLPAERTVSPRVSMHPNLLSYDVVSDDGANVGRNRDGTVTPLGVSGEGHGHLELGEVVHRDAHALGHDEVNWREYWWYADPDLAPADHTDGPGQVCYLQDMGDVRNHRHHGLIGALVVEPGNVRACDPDTGEAKWWGVHSVLKAGARTVAHEQVVIVQDGIRPFVAGNPDYPVPDVVPGDDPEDSGFKALNYRGGPDRAERGLAGLTTGPTLTAKRNVPLWLRLVGGNDKPRQHTLTVHGLAWEIAPWVEGGPMIGSASGVTTGWADNVVVRPRYRGDHSIRSGVYRWSTEQGMAGIVRVMP